eukprot:m.48007 g.48007  ORF g.48007 m.48007 type:complete len:175 (+) comp10544_c0_seq2:52-576(+)
METPIVGYWNTRAIGEPVRLLLNYVGIDFVDKRYECGPPPDYNKSDWLDTKHTLGLDLPNLPYYIDNNEGVKLTQMHAIMYFLGHKHNMAGNSLQEQTRCCMMMEALHDWFDEFWHVTYCSVRSSQRKKKKRVCVYVGEKERKKDRENENDLELVIYFIFFSQGAMDNASSRGC